MPWSAVAAYSRACLPPRALAALVTGKALGEASRRLGRGGGTALPGVVAGRVDPSLTRRLAAQLGAGRAVVTGTNGKTTAARLLAGITAAAGRRPVHNRTGSNLMRGIGTTLLGAAGVGGRIPGAPRRAGVFEVDEATLPHAVRALRPGVAVFINLFRDQLDRYGEVDSILSLWRESLALLPSGATLVLNADDPSVAGLGEGYDGPVLYYGVDNPGEEVAGAAGEEHAADARWCHRCGTEYVYAPIYYGHVGHWRCPGCGRTRPRPRVAATAITAREGGLGLTVVEDGRQIELNVALEGLYNAYNALAAFAGGRALGIGTEAIVAGLARFTAAFGRQEQVGVNGRDVRLLLCKNPAGTNQVLATVLADSEPLHLLLALNDGIQDGRDISWIWDVDFERLAGRTALAVTTGTRARDLALRLKYAGLGEHLSVEPDPRGALDAALAATPAGTRLYILPTYTAMMTLRELVAARGGGRQFWRQ
jgi:UDP-N-acetylmuramyl tripeptide synthase